MMVRLCSFPRASRNAASHCLSTVSPLTKRIPTYLKFYKIPVPCVIPHGAGVPVYAEHSVDLVFFCDFNRIVAVECIHISNFSSGYGFSKICLSLLESLLFCYGCLSLRIPGHVAIFCVPHHVRPHLRKYLSSIFVDQQLERIHICAFL